MASAVGPLLPVKSSGKGWPAYRTETRQDLGLHTPDGWGRGLI